MRPTIALLIAAGLMTFTTAATANSPACSVAGIVGSAPAQAAETVPTDARFVFVTDGGCRGPITAQLKDSSGAIVSAVVTPAGFGEGGYFYSVRPSAPLETTATYSLTVVEEKSVGGSMSMTTTSPAKFVASARGATTLDAVALSWESPTGADGYARASVRFVARQQGADRLGIYRLGGPKTVDGSWAAYAKLAAGNEEVSFAASGWARPTGPSCFTVAYEDALGTLSTPSAEACITPQSAPPSAQPIGDIPETPGTNLSNASGSSADSGGSDGCSTTGGLRSRGGASALAIAAAAMILAARRRRRG